MEEVRPRCYDGRVRQNAIAGLGGDNPTRFLANNLTETAGEVGIRHAG
jgi:hypothetical protein